MKKKTNKKEKQLKKNKSFLERYGHKAISAPEYKDSVKYIRKMRDAE
jgi:hypothetical protein